MTDELPPLWALDMAAKAAGVEAWANEDGRPWAKEVILPSIIAHARTLAADPDRYKPVDPAEEQRWKDAREAAAVFYDARGAAIVAENRRSGLYDGVSDIRAAYIALCNRDGVTPNLGGGK